MAFGHQQGADEAADDQDQAGHHQEIAPRFDPGVPGGTGRTTGARHLHGLVQDRAGGQENHPGGEHAA
ncbi:MAG: hypothetical protein Q9Q13_01220 [Acidobacteriota bacterium]|nr:hypothetical protein [Acidobacteriota bacterium]